MKIKYLEVTNFHAINAIKLNDIDRVMVPRMQEWEDTVAISTINDISMCKEIIRCI